MSGIRATIDYLLFDWMNVESLTAHPRFAEHGRNTFDAVLDLCEKLAEEKFAPFNRLVDTEEPVFDGERVTLPAATTEACRAYGESGMLAAAQDYELGGMQLPCVVEMAANSFFSAASIGIKAYSLLTVGNANLLMASGTELQKKVFARNQFAGRFFGTMNLSEPHAGSSLAHILTRAVPDGPEHATDPLGPRYRVSGRKMWISAGEHDIAENIIHLVLAKIPKPDGQLPDGAGGISLFIVPRHLVDSHGRLTGERNDIALAGLNHKLGYRATTNTLLNYGEGRYPVRAPGGTDGRGSGAIGYLVGKPGEGLACMFQMMNEARIQVGMGATMLGFSAYLASLHYARERLQGQSITARGTVKAGVGRAAVPIIDHPDVKRMLLAQKSYCEGALALQLYCSRLVDESRNGDRGEAARASVLLEVLTPIAKSWPSEWCQEGNSLAIQVLGGCGYTRDFPVEQHWRDNRLNMIHEGTHGIHGLDLLGRKVRMQKGLGLRVLLDSMNDSIKKAATLPLSSPLAHILSGTVSSIETDTRAAWVDEDPAAALSNATLYLKAMGHAVIAWMWLELSVTSERRLEEPRSESDKDFHRGKLAAANYFFRYEVPHIEVWSSIVAARDLTCHNTDSAWF